MALTKITSNVIADNAITQGKIDSQVNLGGPKITTIQITNNSYTVLDDTAVDTAGGYIRINGSGFTSGCQVLINNVPATSTTFVSSTQVNAQLPATVAGTYIVYLVNSDGGVAIKVNGVTFSAMPAWVTGSSLEGIVDVFVSIQLNATDASTYILQAGSTLPTGLTLTSGGLLSGTVTGLTTETLYSFTVIATDAQNQDSPRSFNITISVGDQYFNRTVLAINGDVNTFVTDASTNNFLVTTIADTKPSTISPYNTNWSNYFDGSGDQLGIASNSAFTMGTGDFCYEAWVYLLRQTNTYGQGIISCGNPNSIGTDVLQFQINSTGYLSASIADGNANLLSSASLFPLNQWVHVVFCRSGTSVALFQNGSRTATATSSANHSGGALVIGGQWYTNEAARQLQGYLSNARVVKGSSIYDPTQTTLTVPTSSLTTNPTGLGAGSVSILTCQSNRFIDNSTNNFAITRNGDTRSIAFGPFTETDTTTGSAYLDGTGDYITVANNAAFNLPGDFTIEFWVNNNSVGTNPSYICIGNTAATNNGFLIYYSSGTTSLRVYSNGAALIVGPTLANSIWYHIAVVRSGSGSNNLTLYVNGVSAGQATNTATFTGVAGNGVSIGSEYTTSHTVANNFYISNVRIVKGTAVYTSAFTPPASPLTAITNTSLLTLQTRQPFNNHTFLDNTYFDNVITKSGNTTQGSFSPFTPAGWSNYFDGTGDYLTFSATSTQIIGQTSLTSTSTFTIEAWIYPLAASGASNSGLIIGDMSPTTSTVYWTFGPNNSNLITFYWFDGAQKSCSGNTSIPLNTWSHVAISISSGAIKMFVNGVLQTLTGTTTLTNATGSLNAYAIGSNNNTAINAYISNLRIVKSALYSTTFNVPSTELTAITDTSLLTCQSNRFKDHSTNNFTITKTGNTRVVNFSGIRPSALYSPATNIGSAYFDGSDRLDITGSSRLNLAGAFTIEGWYYTSTVTDYAVVFELNTYTNGILFRPGVGTQGTLWINGTQYVTGTTAPPIYDSWVHFVIVRNSANSTSLYMNGVRLWNATLSGAINTSNGSLRLAEATHTTGQNFTGYISNFKIYNGSNSYDPTQTTITVPSSPVNNTNASLLLNFNNFGIVDVTTRNVLESVGDVKIRTDFEKYGVGSMYFDGTGDYLVSYSPQTILNCTFGTGDFTIEAWVNFATVGTNLGISDISPNTTTSNTSSWYLYRVSTNLIGFGVHGAGPLVSTTTTTAASTWYHVAVTRSGTSLRMFLNGVIEGTATNSTNLIASGLHVGLIATPYVMNGYIDDFRITKGFARYTANFTPPTSTFIAR